MAAKKKATRKKTTTPKRKTTRKPKVKAPRKVTVKKEIGPNFMVQVNEPKALRKDLLESLRETIIFMQGYEAFKKIQEEKVETFTLLKEDIKTLNNLVNKLKKHLPKGKLTAIGLKSIVRPRVPELPSEPEPSEPENPESEHLENHNVGQPPEVEKKSFPPSI